MSWVCVNVRSVNGPQPMSSAGEAWGRDMKSGLVYFDGHRIWWVVREPLDMILPLDGPLSP